jgi:hypothetical protein
LLSERCWWWLLELGPEIDALWLVLASWAAGRLGDATAGDDAGAELVDPWALVLLPALVLAELLAVVVPLPAPELMSAPAAAAAAARI